MVAPKTFNWFFGGACIAAPKKVFLFGQSEDFVDQESDEPQVSYVFRWDGNWSSRSVPTFVVSVCNVNMSEPTALFLGQNGVVIRLSKTTSFEPEVIDDSDDGPQFIGDMTEIRTIGGKAYACGMGRTVYRCEGIATWRRFDTGVRTKAGDDSDAGFNSIDGFAESDIYAVGWNGEIWRFDGVNWSQRDSPTNLALLKAVCSRSGQVYVGGQEGLVLIGRDSSWQEMHLPDTDADVTGVTEFNGVIYFSTSEGLYRLDSTGLILVDVTKGGGKIGLRPGESFGSLDADQNVIWSVGPKMAIFSNDGNKWTETSYS